MLCPQQVEHALDGREGAGRNLDADRVPARHRAVPEARPLERAQLAALVRLARQEHGALVHEAAQAFSRAALGPEGVEGMTAFLQKRKAKWTPQ